MPLQTFIPGRRQFPRLGGDLQLEIQQTHSQLDQRLVSCRAFTPVARHFTLASDLFQGSCCLQRHIQLLYMKAS